MKNFRIKEETGFLEVCFPGLRVADTIIRSHSHESQLVPPVAFIIEETHGIIEHPWRVKEVHFRKRILCLKPGLQCSGSWYGWRFHVLNCGTEGEACRKLGVSEYVTMLSERKPSSGVKIAS